MAHDHSALSELFSKVKEDPDYAKDIIRLTLQATFQDLINEESKEFIGAGTYERSEGRTNSRNGTRPRTLKTKGGDLELAIPKMRKGSFFPSLLEPRKLIDKLSSDV
ncbi:hypothetical protein CPHO_11265 [Corynebacterium phocae]|uniref:Mutator family transposase n=1 Tax=Corynebacterium phocae TaxID=161895 RepID=A0A1L7D5E8_9CORY|nr:transposase [Corynebacterium phocae]APT93369.1 hypothetical protein CPHO_11265 [Corynebacterium phocae]